MELRPTILLVACLLWSTATACTYRTEGRGPEVATRMPAPLPVLPLWSDPLAPSITEVTGNGHPIGFAVLDTNGVAMAMTRLQHEGQVELWRPDAIRLEELPLSLDPSVVRSLDARIAIVELARTDPRRDLGIPPRRAVDGMLFTPHALGEDRLVVILGSLARFNPGERWLVTAFLREGWHVLLSSPPITSPDQDLGDATIISAGTDPEKAGRVLAGEMEVAIGAWAVGLSTIAGEFQRDGLLPGSSTAIVGMSSGGLAAPATAALMDPLRRVDAVALLATGTDPPVIVARTSLEDEDLRIDRRGPWVSQEDLEIFRCSYRAASTLEDDGLWSWFTDRPILLVEAGFDAAIPRPSRSALRLRMPDAAHWWIPTGHFGLFASMINQAGPIVEWVGHACPAGLKKTGQNPLPVPSERSEAGNR